MTSIPSSNERKNQHSYENFRRVFARAAKNGLPRFDVRVSMNVWVSSQNMAGLTHGSFFMRWATRNGLSETCFLPRICSHFCKFWQRFSHFSGSACTTAFVFDEGIGGDTYHFLGSPGLFLHQARNSLGFGHFCGGSGRNLVSSWTFRKHWSVPEITEQTPGWATLSTGDGGH